MPDPIERDPDLIQSSHWQAEPPGEDGLYAGVWVDGSTFLVELAKARDGHRVAFCLSDGEAIGLEEVSWWFVSSIPPPPLPEEG